MRLNFLIHIRFDIWLKVDIRSMEFSYSDEVNNIMVPRETVKVAGGQSAPCLLSRPVLRCGKNGHKAVMAHPPNLPLTITCEPLWIINA